MPADIFLKLDGVEGESKAEKHEGEIEVVSWSWGAHQTGAGQDGSGAGKVSIQDLTITKHMDKSSPNLFGSCCTGKQISKAVLTVRTAGGEKPLEYFKLHLDQVQISNYSTGGHGQEKATEQVSLHFNKVKLEYVPRKSDGSGGPVVSRGWDIGLHKE